MSRSSVLIRADAGVLIGTGHIMRSLVLARALRKLSVPVSWLCRTLPDPTRELLERDGFPIHDLGHETLEVEGISKTADDLNASCVVVDHYGIDWQVEGSLRQAGLAVMAMDDTYCRHDCDIVLNQNVFADGKRYRGLVGNETQLLMGWPYSLLRDEFVNLERRIRSTPSIDSLSMLVAFGGSDPANMTMKTLRGLALLGSPGMQVSIIVGGANPLLKRIKAAVAGSDLDATILSNVGDMAHRMNQADLAITAGGSMHLEFIASTLPSLMVAIADNQTGATKAMGEKGLAVDLGWHEDVTDEGIASAVVALVSHPSRYEEMVKRLQGYESPGGAHRVAEAIVERINRGSP